ncbi:MAG: 2OG-Fe(II) oxygenase, partial [Planctomycetaceae bacterium]
FTHSHCGHVPKSGHKYILTSWVLFNRAEQIFAQQTQ